MEETDKTEKKLKRAVVKRTARQAAKEAAEKEGCAVVSLKGVPTSPRKMRLVADLIRGERVSKALNMLKHETKHPAHKLEKLLLSAVSNWELRKPDLKLEEIDLFVKQIYVSQGKILKRIRPAPQGRAHRINKRSNHVTLVIANRGGQNKKEQQKEQQEEKKESTSKKDKIDGAKS